MAQKQPKQEHGDGEEWGGEVVEALCSTDLASMRECLLEKIVNQKKMELMRSPEVMTFLAKKQKHPTAQCMSQDLSEKPNEAPSNEKSSGEKSRKRTLERTGGERRSLRSRRDVTMEMTSSGTSRGVDSDKSNNADSRTREDRTLPTSRS